MDTQIYRKMITSPSNILCCHIVRENNFNIEAVSTQTTDMGW